MRLKRLSLLTPEGAVIQPFTCRIDHLNAVNFNKMVFKNP